VCVYYTYIIYVHVHTHTHTHIHAHTHTHTHTHTCACAGIRVLGEGGFKALVLQIHYDNVDGDEGKVALFF